VLAYLSEPGTVSLRLETLTAGKQARAEWINPASGAREPAGMFARTGTEAFTSPPGWEDAVLFVEAG
jgi:hypothetical protein